MNPPPPPSISVVIPSWNGRMLLEEMLPSLLLATKEFQDQTGGSWEVIVVDDGSVDDTIPWIETIPEKRIKLITRRRESGFALAYNLGFSACRYETVILLSNDVIVDKEFVLPLIPHFRNEKVFGVSFKALSRDRSAFQAGGKIGEFRMGFWKAARNYDRMDGIVTDPSQVALYSFNVHGGFCAMNRRKLRDLGGFEPLMSPFFWEDVELSYRAWKRGWVIHYEPDSIVCQDASHHIRGTYTRMRFERINTRNHFIFMWKNLHDPGMFLVHLGATFLHILRALLTLRAAFILGLWDSICQLPAILSKRRKEKKDSRIKDRHIQKTFMDFKKNGAIVIK